MDKCHQDKYFLDKCWFCSWNLFKMVPGTYLSNYLKIRSASAKIFLIWTNVARTNIAWTNVAIAVEICSRWSQEPIFKIWSNSDQYQLRYFCNGQMSPGQMLLGQMSLWHLESVQDGPRNLRLKFCQNRFSNSWDITDIEFSGGWWVVVVVCKVIFTSNPTLGYVRLNWGWVGVLTIVNIW